MAYTITKVPDGDCNFGSLNGEFVVLQPAAADYPPGGYAIIDGVSVVNNPSLSANCDLYRLLQADPVGGPGGYLPSYNPATKKMQFFQQGAAAGQFPEVAAGVDLSAFPLTMLLIGL